MEFLREIRQVESTNLSMKLPESFLHQEVEILVLPYHSGQQKKYPESRKNVPLEDLEELRRYYRTFETKITLQTLNDLKEELYRDLF